MPVMNLLHRALDGGGSGGVHEVSLGYGSGQPMIGTLLMLFFGLPSMTRSL
jgi:hypothetical protein